MDWDAVLAANLRRLRKQLGKTQEQLAAEANVAARFLGGMERGEENPSLKVLVALATALNTTPAMLLTPTEELQPR